MWIPIKYILSVMLYIPLLPVSTETAAKPIVKNFLTYCNRKAFRSLNHYQKTLEWLNCGKCRVVCR